MIGSNSQVPFHIFVRRDEIEFSKKMLEAMLSSSPGDAVSVCFIILLNWFKKNVTAVIAHRLPHKRRDKRSSRSNV